jgi:hypothetical protein
MLSAFSETGIAVIFVGALVIVAFLLLLTHYIIAGLPVNHSGSALTNNIALDTMLVPRGYPNPVPFAFDAQFVVSNNGSATKSQIQLTLSANYNHDLATVTAQNTISYYVRDINSTDWDFAPIDSLPLVNTDTDEYSFVLPELPMAKSAFFTVPFYNLTVSELQEIDFVASITSFVPSIDSTPNDNGPATIDIVLRP